ncbi:MAG: ankyrin repeat domain-containing protein [Bacteroidota bacterium]
MKRSILLILALVAFSSTNAQNIFRTACQGNLARLDSMVLDTSIDVQDERERTLLHWAVACNQKEVFSYLIEKGIDINAVDDQEKTPMHMCIRFDNRPFFDTLQQQQVNDDWKKQMGASLLELSVMKKNAAFIKQLIASGIDINATNDRGSTALEIAQRIGAEEIAELLLSLGADAKRIRKIEAFGAYMGQKPPRVTPKVFAPNFVPTEEYEFGSVFNSAGTEFYFGVDVGNYSEIRYSNLENGKWSTPKVLLSGEYSYNDPFLSPDEDRLYFISKRPLEGIGAKKEDHDIWYVEREKEGWSAPVNAGININSPGNEYYISFAQDGTMYFASNKHSVGEKKRSNLDIYYSKFVDGTFQPAISVGDSINTEGYEADVYVNPAETYMIFCSTRKEGFGRGDLYISFRQPNGTWTKAVNMGETVNTNYHELCPFVTADGKFLFYTSNEDIYWVSMEIIDVLRGSSK